MDSILLWEMPSFRPQYKRWEKYGYRKAKEKKNLQKVLEKSSEGFCMYCYSRIRVDGKLYANLEHAIEKSNSEKLIECIPNIGLTCSNCNQILKKAGERKRRIPSEAVAEYESKSRCSVEERKQCTVPCKALRNLQKRYHALPEGKIILQPMGVTGEESGERLALQYDVLKMEFQPASHYHTYSSEDMDFIESHIKRFHLNDPLYRSHQLYDFIRNVIDSGGKLPQYEYNNWTVSQFCRLVSDKTPDEILKICKAIFCISFSKM